MVWNFRKIHSNSYGPWLIRIFGAYKHSNNLVLTQIGVHDILYTVHEIMYGIQDIMYGVQEIMYDIQDIMISGSPILN